MFWTFHTLGKPSHCWKTTDQKNIFLSEFDSKEISFFFRNVTIFENPHPI